MAEELCPKCGCTVTDGGYEKEGVVYCCQPCADASECECGCCKAYEPDKAPGKSD